MLLIVVLLISCAYAQDACGIENCATCKDDRCVKCVNSWSVNSSGLCQRDINCYRWDETTGACNDCSMGFTVSANGVCVSNSNCQKWMK